MVVHDLMPGAIYLFNSHFIVKLQRYIHQWRRINFSSSTTSALSTSSASGCLTRFLREDLGFSAVKSCCPVVVSQCTKAWDNQIIVQQVLPMDQGFWRHLLLAFVTVESILVDYLSGSNSLSRFSFQRTLNTSHEHELLIVLVCGPGPLRLRWHKPCPFRA
jgi:hypothetical protein